MPKYEIVENSTFDVKITLRKYAIQLGILIAITAISFLLDTILPQVTLNYPEYAAIIMVIVPFIEALRNWLKHKDDTETIKIDSETGKPVE